MINLENNFEVKKGTTTVGIVCKDGIVLAADKRASAGYLIANKREQKVHKVSDNIAVTIAGLVSDAQLLVKLIRAQIKLEEIRRLKIIQIKEAANLLGGLLYQNIRRMSMVPGIVAFLLGGKDNQGFHLYELGIDGSITDHSEFASTGSGSVVAYGVLETLYESNLTVDQGVKLAVKSINAAIQRDMPTGNGIDVVTITKNGVKKVLSETIDMNLPSK